MPPLDETAEVASETSEPHVDHDLVNQGETQKFVTFLIAGQAFCLDIVQVQEIRRWTSVTSLPHAPVQVLGVMNLRGSVIPIYDLGTSLGFKPIPQTPRSVVIVSAVKENPVGLLVDAVSEIVSVNLEDIQTTPTVASQSTRDCLKGLVTVDDVVARIIDLDAVTSDQVGLN